jgi:hypothetical protein
METLIMEPIEFNDLLMHPGGQPIPSTSRAGRQVERKFLDAGKLIFKYQGKNDGPKGTKICNVVKNCQMKFVSKISDFHDNQFLLFVNLE